MSCWQCKCVLESSTQKEVWSSADLFPPLPVAIFLQHKGEEHCNHISSLCLGEINLLFSKVLGWWNTAGNQPPSSFGFERHDLLHLRACYGQVPACPPVVDCPNGCGREMLKQTNTITHQTTFLCLVYVVTQFLLPLAHQKWRITSKQRVPHKLGLSWWDLLVSLMLSEGIAEREGEFQQNSHPGFKSSYISKRSDLVLNWEEFGSALCSCLHDLENSEPEIGTDFKASSEVWHLFCSQPQNSSGPWSLYHSLIH